MISQRTRCIHDATAADNRINSIPTCFGFIVSRDNNIVRDPHIRILVEDQISDTPGKVQGLCPIPIPMEVRMILRGEYDRFDRLSAQASEYKTRILEKAYSMEWETDTGTLPGSEMIRIPAAAPQVGELTAAIWLARVITPRHFRNAKALSACCGLDPGLKISAGKVTSTVMRGGNKSLHKALNMSAHLLIYHHNEMSGIRGCNLQQQTGKKEESRKCCCQEVICCLVLYDEDRNRVHI